MFTVMFLVPIVILIGNATEVNKNTFRKESKNLNVSE